MHTLVTRERTMEKKASTRVSSLQQTTNKPNKHTVTGKGKKTKRVEASQSYSSQIVALKANNRQLATALDEVKRDYRKLQKDNLQLKQERQQLLEKVATLEKNARKKSFTEPSMQLLQEAQGKLHEVQSSLEYVLKTSRSSSKCKKEPDRASPKNKVLRFSSPTQYSQRCTIYPRTPHPLHNMTCVVDGPQLCSTPVKTRLSSSMHLSPQRIDYSNSTSVKQPLMTETGVNTKGDLGEKSSSVSPIVEGRENSSIVINPDSTLDQLENALMCCEGVSMNAVRPRRRCTSLSLSYQEPSLNRKLRRGDPFTEQLTDWNPPDNKEKRKKATKTSIPLNQRRVLQDVQNQL